MIESSRDDEGNLNSSCGFITKLIRHTFDELSLEERGGEGWGGGYFEDAPPKFLFNKNKN